MAPASVPPVAGAPPRGSSETSDPIFADKQVKYWNLSHPFSSFLRDHGLY